MITPSRQFLRVLPALLVSLCLGLVAPKGFAQEARRAFDIPSGVAEVTLKLFADQSNAQFFFSADRVRGIGTHAIKGEMDPLQALEGMLAETKLVAVRDEKTGAITIDRAASPNAPRVEPETAATPGSRSKVEDGKVVLDKLEVNATKITGVVNQGIIPREENQAVRYSVITRSDIERTGLTNLPDLMRRVSYNQQSAPNVQLSLALSNAGTGYLISQPETVNLRGLGAAQTLIMINGRRIYGGDGTAADISRIPLSAVERIEILPTAGSAIYGANSVGGVINVILRTDYRGTEVSTYYGGSTAGGAEEYRFELFHGAVFNRGRTRLTLSLNHGHQDGLTRGERDYDARVLANPALQPGTAAFNTTILPYMLSTRGTVYTSSPLGLGIPGDASAKYAAVPVGSDGIGLTPASFSTTAGQVSISTTDRIARTLLRNPSTNDAAVLTLDHALAGDAFGAYAELTWRRAEDWATFPTGGSFQNLSATDPRNPFRTNVTPGFVGRAVTIYHAMNDLGDDEQRAVRNTRRVVVGFKGKWEAMNGKGLNWAVDGSWDQNKTDATSRVFGPSWNPASQGGYYYLFRDLTGITVMQEAERQKYSRRGLSSSEPSVAAVNLRLNGDLFDLFGNPVKFSVGAESRREKNQTQSLLREIGEYWFLPGGYTTAPADSIARTVRDVQAGYGEVVAPLVGASNRLPWLHSLEFSLGARYEKYSDFQAATPPVAAVKLGLTRDLAFRVQYAEGFQPPTSAQLSPAIQTSALNSTSTDPLRPGTVTSFTQNVLGNPNLRPETTTTWDAGVILTPRWVRGLTVNASYFRDDKRDVVATQTLTNAILYFPELVVRASPSADDIAAGRPGPVTVFNFMPVNVARQFTDGVDLNLRYDTPETRFGRFLFTTGATWTKRLFSQPRPDSANVNALDLAPLSGSFALAKKGTASVTWIRSAWSATWTGTYNGSFESSTTAPSATNPTGSGIDGARMPSSFIMDLQASYQVAPGKDGWRNWLGGTKWTVGAINFTDKEPAPWSDAIRGFYSPYVDPRQRYVYLQIKKTF